jgi:hypothetical protein
MITRLLPLIPLLARRRRRARVQRGARLGTPALLALGGAAAAYLIRRRRRSAAGYDAAPSELAGRPAGMSEAATATRAASDSAEAATGRATTMDADPDEVAAAAAHGDVVTPDTSADDPLVIDAENAAAADAAAIGGDVPDAPPSPSEEHSGNSFEAFSERES